MPSRTPDERSANPPALPTSAFGSTLTVRILSRANRSVGPHSNCPAGQIGEDAARLCCGDMPPGKRCRLGPLNPHSKVMDFGNQLGHFINALKQSPNTTKTTHIHYSQKPPKFSTCTTRQDFPTPEEYCSTKGECSRPMRERPQGLRPTGLNGTRARTTYRLSAGHVSSIRADARSGA
jgi:hypothetical protein